MRRGSNLFLDGLACGVCGTILMGMFLIMINRGDGSTFTKGLAGSALAVLILGVVLRVQELRWREREAQRLAVEQYHRDMAEQAEERDRRREQAARP